MNNLFSDLPTDLREEVFEKIVESSSVQIERIISKGHHSPKDFWYDQDQHEWVIVLMGAARIQVESTGEVLELNTGSFLNIPAHQRHRVD